MVNPFQRAERKAKRLRIGIEGPGGAGKTFTALKIACQLAEHDKGRVALIDSERGSAAMYGSGKPFDFDSAPLETYEPSEFVKMIKLAEQNHYPVIVVDSASHEWKGTLGIVDRVGAQRQGNTWSGWGTARPAHDAFIDAVTGARAHVICTYRSKQETEQYKDNGKTKVRKLGMSPVASDDTDYEFDLWGSIDHETHNLTITKSRLDSIPTGSEWPQGDGLVEAYLEWVGGAEYDEPTSTPRPAPVRAPVEQQAQPAVQSAASQPARPVPVKAAARKNGAPVYTFLAELVHEMDQRGVTLRDVGVGLKLVASEQTRDGVLAAIGQMVTDGVPLEQVLDIALAPSAPEAPWQERDDPNGVWAKPIQPVLEGEVV